MAVCTVAINSRHSLGNVTLIDATVTFDADYGVNGDTYTALDFGLSGIYPILVILPSQTIDGTATVLQDSTNMKFRLFTGAGVEAVLHSDNHLVTFPVQVFGSP